MKDIPNYGYPLSYIFFRAILILFIVLFFFALHFIGISIMIMLFISIVLISIIGYSFVIRFKKQFLKKREALLKRIIELADIKGDEKILDIGTGSGFLAVGLSKYLKGGKTIGLDRYSLKSKNLRSHIIDVIKTNFFGNTMKNAKDNLEIENVSDKCSFIEADITEPIDFNDRYFDIIVSSQLLYCITKEKRTNVFKEIDRILKKGGKIIFFESKSFINWNIAEAKDYFEKKGYKIKIIPSNEFKTCCILYGIK
jgi:ubiquinone/menaquinone biosynthesis C-methylase UbiE